jgi:hypothetical protein
MNMIPKQARFTQNEDHVAPFSRDELGGMDAGDRPRTGG